MGVTFGSGGCDPYLGYNYSSPLYTRDVLIPSTVGNSSVVYTVTSVSDYAFYQCSKLTSITLPSSITSIGTYAFGLCTNLNLINLPETITSFGNFSFSNTKWYDIQPNGLVLLGKYLCGYKGSMPPNTTIDVPEEIIGVINQAFVFSQNLTNITIPSSVLNLPNDAFAFCTSLVSISVDETNLNFKSENGVLFNKDKTKILCCPESRNGTCVIPSSVEIIGKLAFSNCIYLTSITIPNSVIIIEDQSFDSCKKLNSVEIPNSVTSIGKLAFSDCKSLTSVIIPNSVTSIHSNSFSPIDLSSSASVFDYVPTLSCVLYIPTGSKTAYQNALVWKTFENIVEENTAIQTVSASDLCIKVVGDKAILSKLPDGEMVEVFTLNGKRIYFGKATGTYLEIQLPTNKIYLIKVGTKSTKIMM